MLLYNNISFSWILEWIFIQISRYSKKDIKENILVKRYSFRDGEFAERSCARLYKVNFVKICVLSTNQFSQLQWRCNDCALNDSLIQGGWWYGNCHDANLNGEWLLHPCRRLHFTKKVTKQTNCHPVHCRTLWHRYFTSSNHLSRKWKLQTS